jgi:hypothetical protein
MIVKNETDKYKEMFSKAKGMGMKKPAWSGWCMVLGLYSRQYAVVKVWNLILLRLVQSLFCVNEPKTLLQKKLDIYNQ